MYAIDPDPPFIPPTSNDASLGRGAAYSMRFEEFFDAAIRGDVDRMFLSGGQIDGVRQHQRHRDRPAGPAEGQARRRGRRLQPVGDDRPPHRVDHPAPVRPHAGAGVRLHHRHGAPHPAGQQGRARLHRRRPAVAGHRARHLRLPGGRARLREIFPDVSVAEIRAATGFDAGRGRRPADATAAVGGRAGRAPVARLAPGARVGVLRPASCPGRSPSTRGRLRVLTDGAGLGAVFEPRRVALVGASDRPGTVGRLLWDNLADFPGDVVPVCQAGSVAARPPTPACGRFPGQVDLAVIVTPAATVPDIIRAAADQGVSAVVVLSAGFAETGPDGARLQAEAVAAARAGHVRLVGPNCFGVQNADLPLNASIAAGTPRGGGGVSIVTQSGSYGMAVHALAAEEALRVAKVYAAGNKADITDAELLAYLRRGPGDHGDLPAAGVDHRRPPVLRRGLPHHPGQAGHRRRRRPDRRRAAGRAVRTRPRWPATRPSATPRWRRPGWSGCAPACRSSTRPGRCPASRCRAGARVAVVTNSGGTGVELADLLADEGLEVPELSPVLQDELRALLPGYASAVNPVDMTPAWSLFTTVYPAAIELLARSGEVDVVVPVLLQRSASAEVAAAVRDAVARLRADRIPVPVYVCWVAPRSARRAY